MSDFCTAQYNQEYCTNEECKVKEVCFLYKNRPIGVTYAINTSEKEINLIKTIMKNIIFLKTGNK